MITSLTKIFTFDEKSTKPNFYLKYTSKLIYRCFKSLTLEINIKEELILNFYRKTFKYYELSKTSIALDDDFINKVIDLGNFGQSPNNRKLSVFFSRKLFIITSENKNPELLNRIIRLQTDAEYLVRLEVSKSFCSLLKYSKLDKGFSEKECLKLIVPIINSYIQKEIKLEVLYYSLKAGILYQSLFCSALERLENLLSQYPKEIDSNEEALKVYFMTMKLLELNEMYKKDEIKGIIQKLNDNIIKPYEMYEYYFNKLELFLFRLSDSELLNEMTFWLKLIDSSNLKDKDKDKDKEKDTQKEKEKKSSKGILIKSYLMTNLDIIFKSFKKMEIFNKLFLKLFQEYFQIINSLFKEYYSTKQSNKELKEVKEFKDPYKELLFDFDFCKVCKKLLSVLIIADKNRNMPFLNIYNDNFDLIEIVFDRYEWRENSSVVELLTSSIHLYTVEGFFDKVLKLSKNFYINCTQEKASTQMIELNIKLSIYILKFCSSNQLDEILPYIEIFFLRGSYFTKRHIFNYFEAFILNYSFQYFCQNNFLKLLLSLLRIDSLAIAKSTFEFLKRVTPMIEFDLSWKSQLDEELEILESDLQEKMKISNKDKSLNTMKNYLLNYKQFRFNIVKENYNELYLKDQLKNQETISNLDEVNCVYLANKQAENNVTFYSTKSLFSDKKFKKIDSSLTLNSYNINSAQYSKINPSNKITVKSSSNSFNTKKIGSKMKLKIDSVISRPFSPTLDTSAINSHTKLTSPLLLPINNAIISSRKISGSNISNFFNKPKSKIAPLLKKPSVSAVSKVDLPKIVGKVTTIKKK